MLGTMVDNKFLPMLRTFSTGLDWRGVGHRAVGGERNLRAVMSNGPSEPASQDRNTDGGNDCSLRPLMRRRHQTASR